MALIGSTLSVQPGVMRPAWDVGGPREISAPRAPSAAPAGAGFGSIFEKLVGDVEARQTEASAVTRSVLLGDNPNLHQSVLAMQEASLAFSLMVEVRNKVVESYQELMRMPV